MRTKTESRRTPVRTLPRDARADQVLEFVFNDEQDALCSEQFLLSQQRDMPALQEYLQEMVELDSRPSSPRAH